MPTTTRLRSGIEVTLDITPPSWGVPGRFFDDCALVGSTLAASRELVCGMTRKLRLDVRTIRLVVLVPHGSDLDTIETQRAALIDRLAIALADSSAVPRPRV